MKARHASTRGKFPRPSRLAALMAGLWWAVCPPGAWAQAAPVQQLDVLVNGTPVGRWPVIDRQGLLLVPEDAWTRWALRRPAAAVAQQHEGRSWWPLLALRGAEVRVYPAEHRMELTVAPGLMDGAPVPAVPAARTSTPDAAPAAQPAVQAAAPAASTAEPVLLAAAPQSATPPLGTALGAPTPPPGSLRWRPLDVTINTVSVGRRPSPPAA